MHRTVLSLLLVATAALSVPAAVRADPPAPESAAPQKPPALVLAISVDQFSADEFAQFRRDYAFGLARLEQGAVFPQGYQSHAATETCPGHSTIMTGDHPARTGIVANAWYDPSLSRANKKVYCAEDETNPLSSPDKPVVSAAHLLVPTLGERLKAADPRSRNVAVSGKDRAAMMMGGRNVDAAYWWDGGRFVTLAGRTPSAAARAENASVAALLESGAREYDVPAFCAGKSVALQLRRDLTIGTNRFALPADAADPAAARRAFRISPRIDAATADLALRLVDEMELGKGGAPDVLSVSLSANDYIGHAYGTQGVEMCIQQAALDKTVGTLLSGLDARGIDYVVVLTADHGMIDAPERNALRAFPAAMRASPDLTAGALGKRISAEMGITAPSGPLIYGDGAGGDYTLARDLTADQRARVQARLIALLRASPQVALVLSADEIAGMPMPTGSPQDWTLAQRVRASFYRPRSGDVVAILKRGVNGVIQPGPGYVSTHGSPWDYDRRVPILFWRKGLAGFEQPEPVETVDIAPTLASLVHLKVDQGAFDGRCLDLDPGDQDTCAAPGQ